MSAVTQFVVLVLASSVLAVPHAGHQGHAALHRAHKRQAPPAYGSSSSLAAAVPYPYVAGNSSSTISELSPQSPTLIPTGYGSSSSIANAVPTAYGSSSSEADAIPGTSTLPTAYGVPTAPGPVSEDHTTTLTVQKTSTRTSYTTVYLSKTSATSASQEAPTSYKEVKQVANSKAVGGAVPTSVAEQCGAVTVTRQVTEYITVTASPTAVAPLKSSIIAKPVISASSSSILRSANSTSYAPTAYRSTSVPAQSSKSSQVGAVSAPSAPSAPVYSNPSSSSVATFAPASTPAAPAYSAESSSSEVSPVATSKPSTTSSSESSTSLLPTAYVNKGLSDAVATSSTSAPASHSSTASSSGGKRGLAYNDATLTDCFTGSSEITWAYNWGSSAGDLASGLSFIPTLWGTGSDFVGDWSDNAKSAISSGSTTLFSFNEPDLPAQANLSPAAAAAGYKEYMQPLGGSAKLCAPAVTNSGADGQGLSWLSEFLDQCSDCQIDCINIHWYDSAENTEYFKSHVEQATAIANGKPVYVSEFGATGSDEQITSFLEEVMPWMDSNSDIAGYAYFMVSNGVLVTGTEPSSYGSVYKSYTS